MNWRYSKDVKRVNSLLLIEQGPTDKLVNLVSTLSAINCSSLSVFKHEVAQDRYIRRLFSASCFVGKK
jgi:hypothetical protein